MAGGGPKIRDSEKWNSRPSPSQGHPVQPWASRARYDCHPESGAAPWLTSHCSGTFWGCIWFTMRRKQRGRNQRQIKGGVKCLMEYQGWEAGLSVLAWPCPMPINAVWPVSSLKFHYSGWVGSNQTYISINKAAWEAGCVCISEWDRENQNLKNSGSSKPPAVLFWEADTFLTQLPSKRQRRTCRLRTCTPVPGRGIILQLHKVTIRDTLVGLGWIWNTAEGGLNLQGPLHMVSFCVYGLRLFSLPQTQCNAVVAAGFLHNPLAPTQGCFSETDRRSQQKKYLYQKWCKLRHNH